MERFLSAWRERIVPARERHGFRVLEAYVEQEKSNFYWILHWDGEVAIAEGEDKFLSSPGVSSPQQGFERIYYYYGNVHA